MDSGYFSNNSYDNYSNDSQCQHAETPYALKQCVWVHAIADRTFYI